MKNINIAVTGCGHGDLDTFYRLCEIFKQEGTPIDLLIINGDFQAVRNQEDLGCMHSPEKYHLMREFFRYYNGEKKASVLTIFIGGNHEAVNYQQELYYGGWAAPNMYYMGASNVIRYKGLRVGGISGTYQNADYKKGYYEVSPYKNNRTSELITSYHYREIEICKLLSYPNKLDIMLSHDWPVGIYNYGDLRALLTRRPYFAEEIKDGTLGSPPLATLLERNQPSYWFSAHLHVKFAAIVPHEQGETKFLALDKCLRQRHFMQVISIDIDDAFIDDPHLYYDPEWLMIVKEAQSHLSTSINAIAPASLSISEETRRFVEELFSHAESEQGLPIPTNFIPIAPFYYGTTVDKYNGTIAVRRGNNQTDAYLSMLGLSHVVTIPYEPQNSSEEADANGKECQMEEEDAKDPNALDIDDCFLVWL